MFDGLRELLQSPPAASGAHQSSATLEPDSKRDAPRPVVDRLDLLEDRMLTIERSILSAISQVSEDVNALAAKVAETRAPVSPPARTQLAPAPCQNGMGSAQEPKNHTSSATTPLRDQRGAALRPNQEPPLQPHLHAPSPPLKPTTRNSTIRESVNPDSGPRRTTFFIATPNPKSPNQRTQPVTTDHVDHPDYRYTTNPTTTEPRPMGPGEKQALRLLDVDPDLDNLLFQTRYLRLFSTKKPRLISRKSQAGAFSSGGEGRNSTAGSLNRNSRLTLASTFSSSNLFKESSSLQMSFCSSNMRKNKNKEETLAKTNMRRTRPGLKARLSRLKGSPDSKHNFCRHDSRQSSCDSALSTVSSCSRSSSAGASGVGADTGRGTPTAAHMLCGTCAWLACARPLNPDSSFRR